MDLQKLISEHAPTFVSTLTGKAGFSAEQAQKFVPSAFHSVIDLVKGGGVNLSEVTDPSKAQAVIGKLDVAGLAKSSGVDSPKATSGLQAILPSLLKLVSEKAGGLGALSSLVGGGAGKGGAEKLGGVFGKK